MNKSLPIYDSMNEIVSAVNENDTVIITAETGSGKSTQVPQYLYNAGYNCIITQPRRIACVSLAKRVSEEMQDSEVIGYQTAFESTRTENTKVLFCTDGLQLAKGIKKEDKTVLVIDELHEWNLNIETLIAWIKKYRKDGGKIKVVLMSATVDVSTLISFYDGKVKHIDVPGRVFPVEKNFITENPDASYLSKILDAINRGKNVLAFRPGKKEISDTINKLKEIIGDMNQAVILQMHGELPLEEQAKCFKKFYTSKVIVATNIAQTSITIPDIHVVVDDGLEKRIEVNDGIELLSLNNISQSDVLQRAGRAGRVQEGEYYLCSYYDLRAREEYSLPEINRLLLDKVVLKLYSVGIDAEKIDFYHQPSKESLKEAKDLLKLLSAIDDNGITELGRKLIQYPVSVRSSKIIESAKQYNIVDDIIKVVSILENRSLVNSKHKIPVHENLPDLTRQITYADFTKEDRSDLLAELDILDRIFNREFDDLTAAGINKKSFFRIKEFYDKLSSQVEYDIDKQETEKNDSYYKNFLKCLYAGNPERVFASIYDAFYGVNSCSYKLSRNSCVKRKDSREVVIATPRTIEFTDRWGYNRTIDLIDNVSFIPKDFIYELLDSTKISIVNEEPCLAEYAGCFNIKLSTRYMNSIVIDQKEDKIYEGNPKFDEIFAEYEKEYPYSARRYREYKREREIEENPPKKEVFTGINNIEYEITYPIDYFKPIVKFAHKAWIPKTSGEVTDSNGNQIAFVCDSFMASSCEDLLKKVTEFEVDAKNRKILNQRKIKKIDSLEIFEKDYMSKIGLFQTYDYDELLINNWYGLCVENDTVKTARFSDEKEYETNLAKGLQSLFKDYIRKNCPLSKFKVESNGKENKSAKEAKELFTLYMDENVSKVMITNLEKSKEEIKVIYQDCFDTIEDESWNF